jgi:hypothetical protein
MGLVENERRRNRRNAEVLPFSVARVLSGDSYTLIKQK